MSRCIPDTPAFYLTTAILTIGALCLQAEPSATTAAAASPKPAVTAATPTASQPALTTEATKPAVATQPAAPEQITITVPLLDAAAVTPDATATSATDAPATATASATLPDTAATATAPDTTAPTTVPATATAAHATVSATTTTIAPATAAPATAQQQPLDTANFADTHSLLSPEWGGTGKGASKPKPMPESLTVADQRLQRIYDAQQQVFAQIAADPGITQADRDQRLQNIISNYQSLLLDNPEYVYGYIMYGKFLREVGQRKLANMAFVKANSLDPDIAVVKQQIANYLSEEGDYDLALPYYLAAIRLSPDTAVYHYQLGTLLYTYRKEFLAGGKLTVPVLDKQLQDAFAAATRLAPQERTYALRYAESFFDVTTPDWSKALQLWQELEKTATDPQQEQIILLQKARVLLALGDKEQALTAIAAVTDPSLQGSKLVLEEQLSAKSES